MYVVFIHMTSAKRPVKTAEHSTNLDVAKIKAHFVADDMPDVVTVTVRKHNQLDEVYYTMQGQIGTINTRA